MIASGGVLGVYTPVGTVFDDRAAAGEELANALIAEDLEVDVVLAIPRGGLPLGRKIADALEAPLDVVVAKKIGAPGNPELAIGSVASDGAVWLNDRAIEQLSIDDAYLDVQIREVAAAAKDKADEYRSGREPIDLDGRRVLVVDDGVATGATTRACLRRVRRAGAAHVTLAVPVGPRTSIDDLQEEADRVICLETPAWFGSVGQWYRSFPQVSDREARTYLEAQSRQRE